MAELTSQEIAALRANGQSISAAFQVGKSGVTEGVVKELDTWLGREPLVKVKLLKSARGDEDAKTVATDLATRAGATLVEVRGHTALFYRQRKGRKAPARKRASTKKPSR